MDTNSRKIVALHREFRAGVRIGFLLHLIPFTLWALKLVGYKPELMARLSALFFIVLWAGFILLMVWNVFVWLVRNVEDHNRTP